MNLIDKKVGIWGTGIVAQSIITYLSKNSRCTLYVYDDTPISDERASFFAAHKVAVITDRDIFLRALDILIPSPGVDLAPYTDGLPICYPELDLFFDLYRVQQHQPPIIAITGTVGKTTVTSLMTQLLRASGYRVAELGNIGTGMLDYFSYTETYDYIVMELSSFQLERIARFTPDVAIWTNFSPNHLDRHKTLDAYARAKYQLIARPTRYPPIVPDSLAPLLQKLDHEPRAYTFWSAHEPLGCSIPKSSYTDNWRMVYHALCTLGIDPAPLFARSDWVTPPHRLTFVGTYRGSDFYDDSKATVPLATEAAVAELQARYPNRPLMLLLGGVSKGVDRIAWCGSWSATLNQMSHIYCFGSEAEVLARAISVSGMATSAHATLADAFRALTHRLSVCMDTERCVAGGHAGGHAAGCTGGYVVLFSPAGASFDLFKNYVERGKAFQALVETLNS